MRRSRYTPILILLALLLAALTYAFAATNTVTASIAGDGVGVISGQTVTVHYNLRTGNPVYIDTVDLTLNTALPASPPAPSVHARLQTGLDALSNPLWSGWATCTGAGTAWKCDFSTLNVTVLSVTNIQVVTAQ